MSPEPKRELTIIWAEEKAEIMRRLGDLEARSKTERAMGNLNRTQADDRLDLIEREIKELFDLIELQSPRRGLILISSTSLPDADRLDSLELRLFNVESDLKAIFNHLRVTPVRPSQSVTQPNNQPPPPQVPPGD